MSTERDIERLLDHWFAEGPTEVADRVIDQVADRIGVQAQQPSWRVSWRDSHVNTYLKPLLAVAAVVVIAVAGIVIVNQPSANVVGGPTASPSPSLEPSPSPTAARIIVAGTGLGGKPELSLTVQLPAGWEKADFGALRADPPTGSGTMFFASIIDNTFADPCAHIERSPKVGPTVDEWATALGEIPDMTATEPIRTTVAGLEATYLELMIPASLPCNFDQFYLWQDSPDADWWPTEPNGVIRVWIFDVGGQSVVIAARTASDTPAAVVGELRDVLDTIAFDSAR